MGQQEIMDFFRANPNKVLIPKLLAKEWGVRTNNLMVCCQNMPELYEIKLYDRDTKKWFFGFRVRPGILDPQCL